MDKKLFWIIAGTSEARALIDKLSAYDVNIYASVATSYGQALLDNHPNVKIMCKRMQYEEMSAFLQEHRPDCVIDATHPYAQLVTQNIARACKESGTEFLRLYRAESSHGNEIIHVASTTEAARFLSNTQGAIFLSTGSKELQEFCQVPNFSQRIHARILPMLDGLSKALNLGFAPSNIICMQGPFSKELNKAMLQDCNARYLVTKSSGGSGGFVEKLEAAAELGIQVVVIGRPPDVQGMPPEAIWTRLTELLSNR